MRTNLSAGGFYFRIAGGDAKNCFREPGPARRED